MGRVQGCAPLPPEMTCSFLIQNMQICILSHSHNIIALLKALFFVFTFKICLRHQSVTPFLCGAPPPKENPGFAPELVVMVDISEKYLASE